MSVAILPFPPQSTTRRPFRLSLVLAARAAFQIDRLGEPKHCQLNDLNACINVDLIAEELASIDREGCKYMNAYRGVYRKLQEGLECLSLDDSCCVMFSLPVFS